MKSCKDEDSRIALYLRIKRAIEHHGVLMDSRNGDDTEECDNVLLLKMREHLAFVASYLKAPTQRKLGIAC